MNSHLHKTVTVLLPSTTQGHDGNAVRELAVTCEIRRLRTRERMHFGVRPVEPCELQTAFLSMIVRVQFITHFWRFVLKLLQQSMGPSEVTDITAVRTFRTKKLVYRVVVEYGLQSSHFSNSKYYSTSVNIRQNPTTGALIRCFRRFDTTSFKVHYMKCILLESEQHDLPNGSKILTSF